MNLWLHQVRFLAERGDVRGAERAFAAAVATAGAEAFAQAAQLAVDLARETGSLAPLHWLLRADARAQCGLERPVLEAIADLRIELGDESTAGYDAYARELEEAAGREEARARQLPEEQRRAARERADRLRGFVFDAWRAFDFPGPIVPLTRIVPARYPAIARRAVEKGRGLGCPPDDILRLGGSYGGEDLLTDLEHYDEPEWDEWTPYSLQAAVVRMRIAEELEEDGDGAGARWTLAFAAAFAAQFPTENSQAWDALHELVPRFLDAARRLHAREAAEPLRRMMQAHQGTALLEKYADELTRLGRRTS